jgi:hypothetical protein
MREQIEVIRPLVEGWERGDFSPKPGVTVDGVVLTAFTADGHERAQGAEEIAAYLRRFFKQFSDYHVDVASVSVLDESHLLLEGNQYGTGRGSGLEIAERLFVVFALRDGKVSEMHWHPRREGALEAAGLPVD